MDSPRRVPRRALVVLCLVAAAAVVARASIGTGESHPGVGAQAKPTSSSIQTTSPTPTPAVTGFSMPIAGGCLPKGDQLMPNAARPYRKGIHEGIDFYNVDNCTRIVRGTHVLAAKAGMVVRADLAFVEVTQKQMAALLANPNADASVDRFRGRQIWIDHGNGVVSRYCHLDGVAAGITQGVAVTAGQLVGLVGETGTPSSLSNPGHEYHLHFELRVGSSFVGQGQKPARVRDLYRAAFGLTAK